MVRPMKIETVAQVLSALDAYGLEPIVFGGWSVDGCVGIHHSGYARASGRFCKMRTHPQTRFGLCLEKQCMFLDRLPKSGTCFGRR